MPPFNTLLFWLGGVLTESIAELTIGALKPGFGPNERLQWKPAIDPLAVDLILGLIEPGDYCKSVIWACSGKIAREELEARILVRARVRTDVLSVIRRIPAGYEKWLISDFPPPWFAELSDRALIAEIFSPDRMVYTSQLGIKRLNPDIYSSVPAAAKHKMNECIMVDGGSRRAVEGIKRGLVSIIYVYPAQLAHELALQKIIAGEVEVMHPSSSERVILL